MKTTLLAVLLLTCVGKTALGDARREHAITAFLSTTGHGAISEKLLVTSVDFSQDGHAEFLLCFSVSSYFKHVGHTWTVLAWKSGKWTEVKTKDSSDVVFDENAASFVHLKRYHYSGILWHPHKQWWFTYLQGGKLKTARFESASDVSMTEEELKKLADANKINVEERPLQ